jgi:hypothetical protein
MGLTGDLRTMPLPDVLQWIATGRKSGTLYVDRGSVQKKLILRDGNVHTSWSNDPRESLGQHLIRLRLVTEEQLFHALLAQETQGRLLGEILVEQRLISEDDLRRALAAKAEETLYDLFLWPAGQFEFKEGELPDRVLITIDTPVTPVILEGIRRVDEWQRIQAVIPSMETTLQPATPLPAEASPDDAQVVALAASGRSLAEIALELRTSEFDAASRAFSLHERGNLRIGTLRAAAPATDTVGAIQALLALATERLKERKFDGARKAYEDVLALDRLNQHAKKGLLLTAEARERERTLSAIPRDRVPRLAVDFATLTRQNLDPHEGFVLSRVNGEWDVQSILKLCPMAEDDTLSIFSRLLDRKLIQFS